MAETIPILQAKLTMQLKKEIIQRVVYLLLLIFYVFAWLVNANYKNLHLESSLGLAYWMVDLLVVVPILFQAAFNSLVGWIILLSLAFAHFMLALSKLTGANQQDYLMPLVLFYVAAAALLYFLYPQKKSVCGGRLK